MVYFYYATVFETIHNWLGLNCTAGFFNTVLLSILIVMTMLNYIMAILSGDLGPCLNIIRYN